MTLETDKQLAAETAATEVRDGMIVGLGTGSTAAFLIAHLGQRVRDGLRITAVATSAATGRAAIDAGIPIVALDDLATIDLAIDGVDEIDAACRAIKGAGGAMLREKIIARAARRMVAIADGSKRVDRLGTRPVPAEILPMARGFVVASVAALGGNAAVRMDGGRPYRTDQHNLVLDCAFSELPDPVAMAAQLSAIPGLIGHGLFVSEIACAYIAQGGVVKRLDRRG